MSISSLIFKKLSLNLFKVVIVLCLVTMISCGDVKQIHNESQQEALPTNRFQLTHTQNMWNYLLLDTWTGRLWQCQYTVMTDADLKKPKQEQPYRGCEHLDTAIKVLPADSSNLKYYNNY